MFSANIVIVKTEILIKIFYFNLPKPPISMEQESMETTPSDGSDVTNADGSTKPFWMKSKLAGGEWSFYFFIC